MGRRGIWCTSTLCLDIDNSDRSLRQRNKRTIHQRKPSAESEMGCVVRPSLASLEKTQRASGRDRPSDTLAIQAPLLEDFVWISLTIRGSLKLGVVHK